MNLRGNFGEVGWGWRLMLGTVAVIGVTRLGCMAAKSMAGDYAQFTNTRAPADAIHNTRQLVGQATGEDEANARMVAENARLNRLLNDRQATCEQILGREQATGQPSAADAASQLVACRLEVSELGRTRLTRDQCNREVVENYNRVCRQVCPTAPQLELQLAVPR